MGMSKQEAKKQLERKYGTRTDVTAGGIVFSNLRPDKETVFAIIDQITIDHPKSKLPLEVGEELDQFAARYVDVLQFAYHLYALSATEFPALVNWMCSAERRWVIIDAYRYGWEAEKLKRYVLPMPGTEYHNIQMHGNAQYYAIKGNGNWRPDAIALGTDDAVKHGYTVAQSDIDAAPGWVKTITPVEVTDDEN